MSEYKLHADQLSVELQTLQITLEELRGCSDEVSRLSLELEREKGRLAGLHVQLMCPFGLG